VDPRNVSFVAFFLRWADCQNWIVPDIHVRACHWLEHRGELAVLRCFRGFGKSTLLAAYNAWRLWRDPTYRILHQGDQDRTAYKTSRDTRAVLMRHPWTRAAFGQGIRGEVPFWWAPGSVDERNPSMQAAGITSNITSSRCDEAQNDDVEVPRNITNPELREKMRYRLGEQTHCMVPGARQLFVGTPHTHDTIYDEVERMGADCLTIPMFDSEHRIEQALRTRYVLPFVPELVFAGIGAATRLLAEGSEYWIEGRTIVFAQAPGTLVDCYAGCAWPERFTPADLLKRRRKCKTLNTWDSQYQLHSRPMHEVRLDPERITAYDVEPRLVRANKVLTMWLGSVQVVSCAMRWDPSSGKVGRDVSAVALAFQDGAGRHYLHRVVALQGDIAQTTDDGRRIVDGQVWQLCDLIEKYNVPRVVVETNGIGGFAPKFLQMALRQRQLRCAVVEVDATAAKAKRILEALEPLIESGMLWAHVDVLDGDLWDQMRDWVPTDRDQADDLLDACAGAVTDQPARIGQTVRIVEAPAREDWRPVAGVYDVTLER
jgi:hypothetical protein